MPVEPIGSDWIFHSIEFIDVGIFLARKLILKTPAKTQKKKVINGGNGPISPI